MKRLIFVLLFLLVVAAAGWYFYPRLSPEPQRKDSLLLSGNIEAHESVLGFKVQGRIVELPVQEGQWVEEHAVLARLGAEDLLQQVRVEEAALQVRQAELTLALAGSRKQEIAAAEQTMIEARADLRQKKLDLERARRLYDKDAISAQDKDRAETNFKLAQANTQRARQRYDEAVEGKRKEEVHVAKTNVRQAQARLELARVNLGYSTLRAPKAGVILVRQAELGEIVSAGTPVVTLADLDRVWLRAYVAASDLGRVRWDQAANLHTDTFPNKRYRGRVSFIASKAEFTPKSIETHRERVTLVYRVKIDVENPNQELKPGMPADAVIQLNER